MEKLLRDYQELIELNRVVELEIRQSGWSIDDEDDITMALFSYNGFISAKEYHYHLNEKVRAFYNIKISNKLEYVAFWKKTSEIINFLLTYYIVHQYSINENDDIGYSYVFNKKQDKEISVDGEKCNDIIDEFIKVEYLTLEELRRLASERLLLLKSKTIKAPKVLNKEYSNLCSFQLKSDVNIKDFQIILNKLVSEVNLLESSDEVCNLFNVFKSENVFQEHLKVYIKCETTQFVYIIIKLKPYFNNLKFSEIEKSQSFYTNEQKVIMTANNMSSNKITSPKEKEKIDRIFDLL